MTRRPQRTNSILQALKSLFTPPQTYRRTGQQRRTGFCVSEFLESRELLSGNSFAVDMSEFQVAPAKTELNPARGFLTGPQTGNPLNIATGYLRNNATRLGLTSADISNLQLTNRYVSSGSGTTHLYFQQAVNGIPVVGSNLNVNVARAGQIINVGSSVLPNVSQNTALAAPTLTASEALDALVAKFNWRYEGTPCVLASDASIPTRDEKLSSAGISRAAEIPASLRYVPSADGTVELAWLLNVQTMDSNGWYDATVSAVDGRVLNVIDWMNPASYNAIELPGENPIESPHSLIVDPQLRGNVSSPFGWHDTDGVAGAEFTDTRGNNVFAQEDKDADDLGGTRPDGGADLVFNFPFDPTQGAVANENAAIVNLFYANNVIHDVLYLYGFDEASGNFQFNNYGNGGLGGDQVIADALDGSGTDNANFATPPDGISGRMQMYEFTFTTPTRDSDLDNFIIVHEFGHGLTNRLTGGPANAGALQLAQSRGMGEGWSDFLGLMFVQNSTDTQAGAYSAGNYVLGNPLNDPLGGIRDFPYSFDMTVSPKTYGDFDATTFPHPNGEIMAATLWDLNWLMINGNGSDIVGKGYSADIYDAASGAGNTDLMKTFVEALKLQPANPTYLDFRDAMLDADLSLSGGENEVAIWRAFARRGMGWSANDGGSAASGNVREAFDLPPGLTLEFTVTPTTIREDAGAGSVTATIVRPSISPVNSSLVVTLTSGDTSEITVPATVTIPAGRNSFSFPINVVDDTLLDGTQIVQITGTATIGTRLATAQVSIQVMDHETLTLSISKNSIREDAGAGAAQLTITRSNTDTAPPNTFVVASNRLREYSPQGTLLGTRTIPWPTGVRPAGEQARDVVVMEDGRVAVYNGTTTAYLSLLNPEMNQWQHIAVPGLTSDAAVAGSGGISSTGNYVFLSDMSSSATDPYGVVRVDVTTGATSRFANQSLGYRMFVKDVFGDSIVEIDLKTGATINEFPVPAGISNFADFDNGLAFDGTSLWISGGVTAPNLIYKLDANDGTVQEIHFVSAVGVTSWEGLAWLNDRLYLLGGGTTSIIATYDPLQRRVSNLRNVSAINGTNGIIWKGLAGIQGPDRLIATSVLNGLVVEINPANGDITNQWSHGITATPYGIATANGEIYIGEFQNGTIDVFDRQGTPLRAIDVSLASLEILAALGGDDIQTLVPTEYRYRDIFSGLDNQFYALDQDGVAVGRFDSETLALDVFFNLSRQVNAIAVAGDGTIWGAGVSGILYHFSETGAVLGERNIGAVTFVDIDLNVSGQILLTSTTGRVYVTNTSLALPTSYSAGSTVAYASSGRHQTRSATDLIVQLTNDDPTEISIPSQVIIPAGQQSVTIPINAVDDQELDGTQLATITATATPYADARRSINVLDAEFVGVDIIARSISEAAGVNATQARVFRTDIDGPFNSEFSQSFLNNSPKTILDADKTTSTINVPQQTSRVTDVNVTFSLTHGFLGDLDIFLVSPSGTRVELVTDILSNSTVMTGTTFNDRARTSILDGTVTGTGTETYTGSFLPEGNLLDLNGENPVGEWTLEITDDNEVDFGTLISWRLDIETIGLGALIVALNPTGNPDEITAQQFVTIPANQSEVFIPINAVDDNLLDGTQVAGLRPVTTTVGYRIQSDSVNVLDQEDLIFTVDRSRVTENAGSRALTGMVTRLNSDLSSSFRVDLSSNDPTELTVQAFVDIAAGDSSATFPINAVDDNLLDGTQTVELTATAQAYGSPKSVKVSVDDLESSLLVSGASATVREDAGVFAVTVTRQDQANITSPMVVNLSVINVSSGDAPLTVPASVTIAANQLSTTFNVTVNDDTLLDGTQRASIRATSLGVIPGSSVFSVTDYESLSVTFNSTSIREDNGANAAVGTVTRSNTDIASPLVVTLTSGDVSELTVPATVTILAGARSANFAVNAVNDPILDGTQSVLVTASAAGYYSGTGTMNVLDHEPPVLTAPTATTTNPLPVIRWNPITNALRYDVLLVNLTTGIQQLYPDIIGSSFTPPERLGIGRYRVTVRAIDQLERDGFWSNPRDFVVNTAPVFTAPLSAGSAANGTFPEIAWTAVIDAAGYQLTVNNLTTGRRNVISQLNLATTSYRSTEGLGSGVYSATVRAFNSAREFGLWSTTIQFTVLAAPAVVTPVIGGTFDRTPALTWTAVSGAINYDVMLTNTVTKAVVYRDRYVTGLSYLVPRDLADATYEVTVRAQNGEYFSAWSAPRVFSVGTPPTITTPGNTTTVGSRPTFVWTGISGTERYEIWVQNVDTGVDAFKVDNITQTTFTAQIHLPLAKYRVYVRAISTLGEITEWSEPVEFISGGVANVTSPTANATTVSRPVISWSSVTGAVGYVVQIRNLDTNTVSLTTAPQPGNSYVLTTALPSGRYRVWVQAVSTAEYRSNWGASVDFFVTESAQKNSVPENDSDDLLASVQSLLIPPVAPSAAIPVAPIQVTAAASRSNENVLEENQMMVESAEHLIAAATGIEAIHDAVMSGWDASEWWTARS